MDRVTVMDLIRSAGRADEGESSPSVGRAAAAGAATAGIGLLVCVLLMLGGMLAVPRASAGALDALGVGTLTWLVLGGGRLEATGGTIAFTPLLGLGLLLLLGRFGARRGLPGPPDRRLQGAWLGGYAGVGLVAALLGLLAPFGPAWLWLPVPLVLVPALSLAWAHGLPDPLAGRAARTPAVLRRAVRPGLEGAMAGVAAGSVMALLALLINLDRVSHIHSTLQAGFLGGLVLVLLQGMILPNVAIWGLSFAAGPGFSTARDATTTWSSAQADILPMIPVFAAQPQPGGLPWATHLLVLVPVLIGAGIGHRSLRRVPRLAPTGTKIRVVAAAVLIAALAVALLDVVAGGSLGGEKLSDLGVPAFTLAGVLVLELGLGAVCVVVRDWWLLRR